MSEKAVEKILVTTIVVVFLTPLAAITAFQVGHRIESQKTIASLPYHEGSAVRITTNNKRGVVIEFRGRQAWVRYADDVGRINESLVMLTELEPWEENAK